MSTARPASSPVVPAPEIAVAPDVRDVNEEARDVARALAKTEAFEQSRRSGKRGEMLFAHLKHILRLGRTRARGTRNRQQSDRPHTVFKDVD